jgi:hypothetical protein
MTHPQDTFRCLKLECHNVNFIIMGVGSHSGEVFPLLPFLWPKIPSAMRALTHTQCTHKTRKRMHTQTSRTYITPFHLHVRLIVVHGCRTHTHTDTYTQTHTHTLHVYNNTSIIRFWRNQTQTSMSIYTRIPGNSVISIVVMDLGKRSGL